jgi:hypothetical protein
MLGDAPTPAPVDETETKETKPPEKAALSVNPVTPTLHDALRGKHVTLSVQPFNGPARMSPPIEASKALAYLTAKSNAYEALRASLN